MSRLLVVSHPAVLGVNQEPYRELARRGWEVKVVVPSRWRHDFAEGLLEPEVLDGMEDAVLPTRVALAGRPQRHLYLTRCRSLCARPRPDVAFLEAEPFSLTAIQWSRALAGLGIPFGVQCDENIDRRMPWPIRRQRGRVLAQAAFVAARASGAARMARGWGARGEVGIAPHAVPAWEPVPAPAPARFTVGFAGRLVESKGLLDLLDAVRRLEAPVELELIGNGELRERLEGQPIPGSRVRVLDGFSHEQMPSAYARLDVVVLPSRTTPTWKEQFGRVIAEALWCGVPVVGSDSGEIPWVIEQTGGGLVFPEGDSGALAERLSRLRESPEERRRLAERGRENVERLFALPAATDALERLLLNALGPAGRNDQPV
jgi:glycosyltransferase involved in cell wall biosynthesis